MATPTPPPVPSNPSGKTPTGTNMRDSKERKNQLVVAIMAVAIILLLGGVGYFLYENIQMADQNEALADDQSKLMHEMDVLDKEIKNMETELTDSNQEKEELQQQLLSLQDKISYYKVQVNKLIKEGKLADLEKDKFKGKYDQLEFYNERYRLKIQELERQITELQNENQGLKASVEERDKKLDEVSDENTKYQIKIKAGSRLEADDFKFSGIYENGKEKEAEKGALKARKMNRINVCGNIRNNTIAPAGKRDLYLVVTSPSGTVYKSLATISGYFSYNNKEVVYSSRTALNYSGGVKGFCIPFEPGGEVEFEKGEHSVFIYSSVDADRPDTYLLGKSSIRLR